MVSAAPFLRPFLWLNWILAVFSTLYLPEIDWLLLAFSARCLEKVVPIAELLRQNVSRPASRESVLQDGNEDGHHVPKRMTNTRFPDQVGWSGLSQAGRQ